MKIISHEAAGVNRPEQRRGSVPVATLRWKLWRFSGSRRHEERAALRAEVDSAQARLAADISNLEAGQDPMSRQAMADAGERYTAAGSLLSTASTAGELMVDKRIVAEGLTATRLVRLQKVCPHAFG